MKTVWCNVNLHKADIAVDEQNLIKPDCVNKNQHFDNYHIVVRCRWDSAGMGVHGEGQEGKENTSTGITWKEVQCKDNCQICWLFWILMKLETVEPEAKSFAQSRLFNYSSSTDAM